MEEKLKYVISVGKYTKDGMGDSDIYFETNDLELAQEKFEAQAEYEKKTIKDWYLRPTDYVEVALFERSEEEEFEWCQVIHINYKGEEI